MALQYRLVPPFLHVPEESNFADEWERFCCKLLNLEHGTTEIFVRSPPEQGVDLSYPGRKIAYQCKSVESGKSGDFNTGHAIKSYEAALANQSSIGWVQYALCTNVDVTGAALAKLQGAIPDLIVLPASHWTALCEKHPLEVQRNFRTVIDVQPRHVSYGNELGDVASIFGDEPAPPDTECYVILLYSNRHDTIYRLPVRGGMTVGELVSALCAFFRLPDPATFGNDDISVSLEHSIVLNGRDVPLRQTLAEANIGPGAIVTYWTTTIWRDLQENRETRLDVMQLQTAASFLRLRPKKERRDSALGAYKRMLADRFAELDAELLQSK